MFKFSLRELSIAALTVALGIAWFAEHNRLVAALSQCDALKNQAKEAVIEAEEAKRAEEFIRDRREKDIELISQRLADHELRLSWFCGVNGLYPLISKQPSDSKP